MTQVNENSEPSRRTAIKTAIVGGSVAALANAAISSQAQAKTNEEIKTDKQCIMEAGLTEEEADCWAKVADAAGSFFKLPTLHPEDAKEVAAAIHVVQNKLLGRPTYRKYLEVAKANQKLKRQFEEKKK